MRMLLRPPPRFAAIGENALPGSTPAGNVMMILFMPPRTFACLPDTCGPATTVSFALLSQSVTGNPPGERQLVRRNQPD